MKIFNAEAIREWDQFTIQTEPVTSINLMERAAMACVEWIHERKLLSHPFYIFCGKGNNGGDGLAIARLLSEANCEVTVLIIESGHKGTPEFQINLQRLHQTSALISYIQTEENFHKFTPNAMIIDALLGTGLNRPVEGITEQLITHINQSGCRVLAIDIPSGLFTDHSSKGNPSIIATDTLSFQTYKPAFLVAENERSPGHIHLLDIGLSPEYYGHTRSVGELTDMNMVHAIYKPRNNFAHKGNFGHALLIAGSYGKIGAAALSAGSCLRSGAGLLTVHIPRCGYDILQSVIPEAMVSADAAPSFITNLEEDLKKYDAIGIGPGLGNAPETRSVINRLFRDSPCPLVVDADALNMIAGDDQLLELLPAHTIITPHPKEFERLFGPSRDDFARIELAKQKANELNIVIVLKGHHTLIATPGKEYYFNNTGNAGMATAGSGDVLTGILTGLLAQGYEPVQAAILGVYLHGLAGDLAASKQSMEAMIAGDIINYLGHAFLQITTSLNHS